jgi:hypothetical protein
MEDINLEVVVDVEVVSVVVLLKYFVSFGKFSNYFVLFFAWFRLAYSLLKEPFVIYLSCKLNSEL